MPSNSTTARETHTAGPWHVSDLDDRTVGPRRVIGSNTMGDIPQLLAVARVTERMGETAANARLIAAAPEMLTALTELLALYLQFEDFNFAIAKATFDKARAVIAKAEGR